MSNIIKFPTKNTYQGSLYHQLRDFHDQMDEIYTVIDNHHYNLNNSIGVAQTLETEYDEVLAKYVKLVGAEDVEVRMLQYSSNAIVEVDADEGTFNIRWGNGEGDEDEAS
jgi:septum formation topological specificity factor MinE